MSEPVDLEQLEAPLTPVVAVDHSADRAMVRLVYIVAGCALVLALVVGVLSFAYLRASRAAAKLATTVEAQGAALSSQGDLLLAFAGLVASQGDPEAVEKALGEIRRLTEEAARRRAAIAGDDADATPPTPARASSTSRAAAAPTSPATRPPTTRPPTTTTTAPLLRVDPPPVTVTLPAELAMTPAAYGR